jgi:FHA domain
MATCPVGHESASADYCDTCGIRIGTSAPAAAAQPPGQAPPPCPNCGTGRSGQFCEACGFDFNSGRAPSRPAPASIHGAPTISAPVIRRRDSSGPVSSQPGSSQPASSPAAPSQGVPVGPSPTAPYPAGLSTAGSAPAAWPPAGAGPDAPDTARWSTVVRSDRAYYESVVAAGGADAAAIRFPEYCPERRFQLTGPQMRIGRISPSRGFEPEIDLTGPPTDPGVSRLHAVLIPEPDGAWAILDPGSENGTHVNDVEIPTDQRVRLRDGDRIHLGAWTVLTIHAS